MGRLEECPPRLRLATRLGLDYSVPVVTPVANVDLRVVTNITPWTLIVVGLCKSVEHG